MNKKIALIVEDSANTWFRVMTDDGNGNKMEIASGSDVGRVLNYAAVMLGHSLVIPLSGPDTAL